MAGTLSGMRSRLDELGTGDVCGSNRREIMELAFKLYDPQYDLFLKKTQELRSALDREPLQHDGAQSGFWESCMSKIPDFDNDRKKEILHEVLLKILLEKLEKFRSDEGRLSKYIEHRMRYDVVDWVRKEFGRDKKKGDKEEAVGEEQSEETERRRRLPVSIHTPVGEGNVTAEELGLVHWPGSDESDEGMSEYEEVEYRSERTISRALEFIATALLLAANRDKNSQARISPKKLPPFKVAYTTGIINIEHDGDAEPAFQYRKRVEEALEGPFLDHCLDDQKCRTLTSIRRSPIKQEFFKPFPKGKGKDEREEEQEDEKGRKDKKQKSVEFQDPRLVGTVMDKAGLSYLNVAKGTYSGYKNEFGKVFSKALIDQGILSAQ